jgi:hypothetical protein
VARVPAAEVEAVIVEAVRRHLGPDAPVDNAKLITMHVDRIVVKRTEIAISFLSEDLASDDDEDGPIVLTVPWSKSPHRRRRDVIIPEGSSGDLPQGLAAEPGPIKFAPYMREVARAIGAPKIERVGLMKSVCGRRITRLPLPEKRSEKRREGANA